MRIILPILILACAGCTSYRAPPGSFMKRYAGYDPADLKSAPAVPDIKAPGHVTP